MRSSDTPLLRLPPTVLVRHLHGHAETRQQHARAAHRGDEIRVGRGAYVDRSEWDHLGARERHLVRASAFGRTRATPPVFSHWSAAALHDLPFARDRADFIHIAVGRTSGGRSARDVRAHSVDVPQDDIVDVHGMRCTGLERTVVDIAATSSRAEAVAVADHVLAGADARDLVSGEARREALLAAWMRAQPLRGHRRALEVIGFADGRAESPLESISRVAMHEAGLPRPLLQEPFDDRRGRIGYADFAWPEFGLIGEADGDAKYLDASLRGGRSAERVVLDEKIREDRLRALGWTVVRWRWSTAREAGALARLLSDAGLPADPRTRWDDCAVS
ncbi:hypothetical protein [Leifsonia shinshuensis]|uniref:hypothetical protein n=1 Tax=Leifsonia shinshuensis TaxID=150026 RepID=UPI002864B3DC|nr:hypothetical protein [Leifsonia shinshuensis]MDR6971485.1 hypothetical protein [Leifsonia shinshuensis]